MLWLHHPERSGQGQQRVSGPELLIIASLFAVGGLAVTILHFKDGPPANAETSAQQSVPSDEKPWIAVQDELTDRIVATVADPAGVVVRTLAAPTDRRAPEDLTPYEAVLRYFLFRQRLSTQDHLITRSALEKAVERDPGTSALFYEGHWRISNPCCPRHPTEPPQQRYHGNGRHPDGLFG